MAGDWIAWTKGLAFKSEVMAMARLLGLDRRVVACLCMEVWEWADSNTADGHVASVTNVALDALTGVTGFGQAMQQVGWLAEDATGLAFPRWDRWNAASAKKRLQNAARMQRKRQSERPGASKCASNVQEMCGSEAHKRNTTVQYSTEQRKEGCIDTGGLEKKTKGASEKVNRDSATQEAQALVKLYGRKVKPPALDHSRPQARINAAKLIRVEHRAAADLESAVLAYAQWCIRHEVAPEMRKNAGNFFGQERVFEHYLPGGEGVTKEPEPPTEDERMTAKYGPGWRELPICALEAGEMTLEEARKSRGLPVSEAPASATVPSVQEADT